MVAKFSRGLSLEYTATKINILTSRKIFDMYEAFNRLNWLDATISAANNSNASTVVTGDRGHGNLFPNKCIGSERGGRGHLIVFIITYRDTLKIGAGIIIKSQSIVLHLLLSCYKSCE